MDILFPGVAPWVGVSAVPTPTLRFSDLIGGTQQNPFYSHLHFITVTGHRSRRLEIREVEFTFFHKKGTHFLSLSVT